MTSINNLTEANEALRELAEVQRQRLRIASDCQAKIDALKREAENADNAWARDESELTEALKKFVRGKFFASHLKMLNVRTIRLNAGVIGFRKLPDRLTMAKGFTEADAIAAIKKRLPREEWDVVIQTREYLRRDELKQLYEEVELAKFGLSLSSKESVVIEPCSDVSPQPPAMAAKETAA